MVDLIDRTAGYGYSVASMMEAGLRVFHPKRCINDMKSRFYALMALDTVRGIASPEKLKALGLAQETEMLWDASFQSQRRWPFNRKILV
jgi:hypothetical protein